jgi:hypothetical protein
MSVSHTRAASTYSWLLIPKETFVDIAVECHGDHYDDSFSESSIKYTYVFCGPVLALIDRQARIWKILQTVRIMFLLFGLLHCCSAEATVVIPAKGIITTTP